MRYREIIGWFYRLAKFCAMPVLMGRRDPFSHAFK
jgi:hypothetical protein